MKQKGLLPKLSYSFLISIFCLATLTANVGVVLSAPSANVITRSYGTISYSPTPTPTPTPGTSTNLAVLPEWVTNPWRGIGGDYDGGSLVYPVTWQGYPNCFKISPNSGYVEWNEYFGWHGQNEVNCGWSGQWTPVSPGDRIYWHFWVWMEPSTAGQTSGYFTPGFDLDGPKGRIGELDYLCRGYPWGGTYQLVRNWNSWSKANQWVEYTIQFTVQDTYIADNNGERSTYYKGEVTYPTHIVPWLILQSWNTHWQYETASAYIRNMEFYINP
jgi:hypothetical protein